jgi:toxin CptA
MMGFAAMTIPGGNDALLLSGLPSLNGNAWAAYAAMMGSLGVVMLLHRAWVRHRRRVHPTDRGVAA